MNDEQEHVMHKFIMPTLQWKQELWTGNKLNGNTPVEKRHKFLFFSFLGKDFFWLNWSVVVYMSMESNYSLVTGFYGTNTWCLCCSDVFCLILIHRRGRWQVYEWMACNLEFRIADAIGVIISKILMDIKSLPTKITKCSLSTQPWGVI